MSSATASLQSVGRLMGARALVIDEAPVPHAEPDDVVIAIEACGICGSDLHFWEDATLPAGTILGHEFAGRIIEAGARVTGVEVGMRVVVDPMKHGVGLGPRPGAFAQFAAVPAASVYPLPPHVSAEAGALIEPLAVALHAIDIAGVSADARVVIFGAGPIGLSILLALLSQGVRKVLVVDVSQYRLRLAEILGAAATLDASTAQPVDFVARHFGEARSGLARRRYADATTIFDCAGVASVLDQAVASIGQGGVLTIVAGHHAPVPIDLNAVLLRELRIVGAVGYGSSFANAVDLVSSGTVDPLPMISHRFPLTDLPAAFSLQRRASESSKVIIKPAGNDLAGEAHMSQQIG